MRWRRRRRRRRRWLEPPLSPQKPDRNSMNTLRCSSKRAGEELAVPEIETEPSTLPGRLTLSSGRQSLIHVRLLQLPRQERPSAAVKVAGDLSVASRRCLVLRPSVNKGG